MPNTANPDPFQRTLVATIVYNLSALVVLSLVGFMFESLLVLPLMAGIAALFVENVLWGFLFVVGMLKSSLSRTISSRLAKFIATFLKHRPVSCLPPLPPADLDLLETATLRRTAWPLWLLPTAALLSVLLIDLLIPGDLAVLKVIAVSHSIVGLIGFGLARRGLITPVPMALEFGGGSGHA